MSQSRNLEVDFKSFLFYSLFTASKTTICTGFILIITVQNEQRKQDFITELRHHTYEGRYVT